MAAYRLYIVKPDGSFIDAHDIEAENDDAAITEARELGDDRPIEVWQWARMVTKIDPSANSKTPGDLFTRFDKQKKP